MAGRSASSRAGRAVTLRSTNAAPGVLASKSGNTMLKERTMTKDDVIHDVRSKDRGGLMNVDRLTDEFIRMMI